MGKRHKRSVKNRNVRKSNRPANSKPEEKTETQTTTESKLTLPPPKEGIAIPKTNASGVGNKNDKKPSWYKRLVVFLLILVLGRLGFQELWPKVMIEPSPAVDSGLLSYQFTFANRPFYPVKVVSTLVSAVDLSWPVVPVNGREYQMKDIGLMRQYTNVQIRRRIYNNEVRLYPLLWCGQTKGGFYYDNQYFLSVAIPIR
jgi:hypothetical protein